MANSPKTFLKHAAKGVQSRSVNPAIIRASTILFKTIQELRKHQKDIAKGKSVAFWDYGTVSYTHLTLPTILLV